MGHFNKEEFGERLKQFRKAKGYSLDYVGLKIKKNATTVGRYENAEIMPDAETISLMCEVLGISEYELFKSDEKINNKENSNNPFNTNKLYLYYNAYYAKSDKYDKGKFVLSIIEKDGICKVDMMDYKTNKIYFSGYLLADTNIAVFVLENYKETNLRLEVTEIILNIARGTNTLMMGTLTCTNKNYIPAFRKCLISETDLEFSDEMYDKVKITEKELEELKEKNIWYADVVNKDDFEE